MSSLLAPRFVLAGTTGLAGGLILIGLAAVVAELGSDHRGAQDARGRQTRGPSARERQWRLKFPLSLPPRRPRSLPVRRPAQANIPSQANVPSRLRHETPVRDPRPTGRCGRSDAVSQVDVSSTAIERLAL